MSQVSDCVRVCLWVCVNNQSLWCVRQKLSKTFVRCSVTVFCVIKHRLCCFNPPISGVFYVTVLGASLFFQWIRTWPEGGGLPVIVVVCEAGESRQTAVISFPQPLLLLSLLLPSADLVVQLGFPVYFLCRLPAEQILRDNYRLAGCKNDISPCSLLIQKSPGFWGEFQIGITHSRIWQSVYFHV